jgi:thiamine-monophosphate kinase
VITTDALVDRVHFDSARMSAAEIGHRAMAANLSDIAAMGARPVLATVALALAGQGEAWVAELYAGMQRLAARHGTRIVGGDLVSAPVLALSLTVVGEVARTRLRRRDGGRAGDVLAVTGPLGASRAGLELERRPQLAVSEDAAAAARRSFRTPEPLVAEGRWLAASRNVHAMMDCSDGLSTDLSRLARAGGLGALVEAVPLAPCVAEIASAAGSVGRDWGLGGGEDFELLVAVAPRAFGYLAARYRARFGRDLLPIGKLIPGEGLVDASGCEIAAAGYDHFRPQAARP